MKVKISQISKNISVKISVSVATTLVQIFRVLVGSHIVIAKFHKRRDFHFGEVIDGSCGKVACENTFRSIIIKNIFTTLMEAKSEFILNTLSA